MSDVLPLRTFPPPHPGPLDRPLRTVLHGVGVNFVRRGDVYDIVIDPGHPPDVRAVVMDELIELLDRAGVRAGDSPLTLASVVGRVDVTVTVDGGNR